ncbi:hypothetical protein HK100_011746, partial [Physocladia obscura]
MHLDATISPNPLFICNIAYDVELSIGVFFRSLSVTANSRIFLIETSTGYLLGTSLGNTSYVNVTDPQQTMIRVKPEQNSDLYSRLVAQTLLARYVSYADIFNSGEIVSFQTTISDGSLWIIST